MKTNWRDFEGRVRHIAQLIWGRPANPENIAGVDIDAVLHLDPQLSVLIEITKERTLGKVREDVTKLVTAQNTLHARRVIARSYCVVDAESVTEAMRTAGQESGIIVLTASQLSRQFFDFDRYKTARMSAPFGSAVNPLTGEKDDTEYVPVLYRIDGTEQDLTTSDIASHLQAGKHVILLGEYGSGKSRCIRETFRVLSHAALDSFCHPIAIDLRESWGLKRGPELIRRHFEDLGLDELSGQAIRAFNANALVVLLDGFDELGSQAWNNDPARLRAIRAHALQGVRDTLNRTAGGVLIAGREHYFTSTEEMFSALGTNATNCLVVKSREEFTDEQLQEFFDQRGIDIEIPAWLPRRPLICQTINNLSEDDRGAMFDAGASETAFWTHFMRVLCVRDAKIHVTFDPDTIYGVLKTLARLTRTKSSNVGPITLSDMQGAFEGTVGQSPGEEASVMLQRLPSLGRLSRETDDRQFTDLYILDGLRAKDVADITLSSLELVRDVLSAGWGNGLDALGQRILASESTCSDGKLLALIREAAAGGNKTLVTDAVSSLAVRKGEKIDFSGLRLDGYHFISLDLSKRLVENLYFHECTFGRIPFGSDHLKGVEISSCLAERVLGASSDKGLPSWAKLTGDIFESVDNTASIRRIGLKPSQQMLMTTIRKTFFQKGAGRKEEALTRGFARIGNPGLIDKVINLMLHEGLLEVSKGREGAVYIPVRKHTARMKQIMAELSNSKDPLWISVTEM